MDMIDFNTLLLFNVTAKYMNEKLFHENTSYEKYAALYTLTCEWDVTFWNGLKDHIESIPVKNTDKDTQINICNDILLYIVKTDNTKIEEIECIKVYHSILENPDTWKLQHAHMYMDYPIECPSLTPLLNSLQITYNKFKQETIYVFNNTNNIYKDIDHATRPKALEYTLKWGTFVLGFETSENNACAISQYNSVYERLNIFFREQKEAEEEGDVEY